MTAAILDKEILTRDRIHQFFSDLMYLAKAAFRDEIQIEPTLFVSRCTGWHTCGFVATWPMEMTL